MTRKLSQNTVNKFKKKLLAEQEHLKSLLERHQEERELGFQKRLQKEVQILPLPMVVQWLLN